MTTKNFKVGTGLDIDGLVLTNSNGELFVNGNAIAVDLSSYVQSNALIATSVDTNLFTTSNALLGINANAFSNALVADGNLVSYLGASGVVTGASTDFNIVNGMLSISMYTDLASKSYVDSFATGLDVKPSVMLATAEEIISSYFSEPGMPTSINIDGFEITTDGAYNGKRILVKNQTDAAQNGIYVVEYPSEGFILLVRAADATFYKSSGEGTLTKGSFTFVESGAYAGQGYVANIAPDVNPGYIVNWSQFSQTGSFITSVANNSPLFVDNTGAVGINYDTNFTTITESAALKLSLASSLAVRDSSYLTDGQIIIHGKGNTSNGDLSAAIQIKPQSKTIASSASEDISLSYSHGEAFIRVTNIDSQDTRLSKILWATDGAGGISFTEYGIIDQVGGTAPINADIEVVRVSNSNFIRITNLSTETYYAGVVTYEMPFAGVPTSGGGGGGK